MEQAVTRAVESTTQTNNMIMWGFAILVLSIVIFVLFVYLPVAIIVQRRDLKCPKCGNWRHNKSSGVQTVSTLEGNKSTVTTQTVVTCKKCKNEFTN